MIAYFYFVCNIAHLDVLVNTYCQTTLHTQWNSTTRTFVQVMLFFKNDSFCMVLCRFVSFIIGSYSNFTWLDLHTMQIPLSSSLIFRKMLSTFNSIQIRLRDTEFFRKMLCRDKRSLFCLCYACRCQRQQSSIIYLPCPLAAYFLLENTESIQNRS